jgi:spore germination protein GerM
MAAGRRNNKRSGSNAGTAFWLAVIVIVLFVFALNWGKIQETLARTNFHEILKTQTTPEKAPAAPKNGAQLPAAIPQASPPASGAPSAAADRPGLPAAPPRSAQPTQTPPPKGSTPAVAAPNAAQPSAAATPTATVPATGPKAAVPTSVQGPARSRSASLFFVRIDDDGVIVRQEARRLIPASDSPLLDSLDALLKGPSEDELRKKLISLVPQGTKLLSAQVRGSTAFINFNEAFMYNHYGIEGYAGQLKQIVYTATAFSTVQDVQILIEGEKHDYLGGEGVYIGRPLSRNSF